MKKRLLYLILPVITLFLEILPYGAVCSFANPEGEPWRHTYSYFDLTPFGYANFAPLLTAAATCVLLLMLVIHVMTGKASLLSGLRTAFFVCAVLSLGPLAFGIAFFSVAGGLITISLLGEAILLHFAVKSRKYGKGEYTVIKHSLFAFIGILCFGFLWCAGCGEQETSDTWEVSDVWKQMPLIELGMLTCEPLEVLPWNCGRCEATSRNQWAETEAGFYYSRGGILWYAEKTDPENWIVVCGQPECGHTDMERCDAKVGGSVVLTETGFYSDDDLLSYPELNPGEGNGYGIYHKSRNGADTRLEYWIDDALLKSAGSVSAILSPEHWLYSVVAMETDGTYTASFYRVTDSGTEKVLEKSTEGGSAWTSWAEFGGDYVFFSMLLGEDPNSVYRFENGELTEVKLGDYRDAACYLSGNTLRIFRPGDGYWDVDLKTGEIAAVASAQLPDSQVMMPLPNCIIETTLEIKDYPAEKPHSMVIFDGERWREVQLPQGLIYAGGSLYSQAGDGLILGCVASDCIFFTSWDRGVTTIYRIPLGAEELVMEYCGQIKN